MKNPIKILSSLLLVVVMACGSNRVQTVKTTDKDLSRYDSFAYLPNSNVDVPGRDYNDEDVNTRIIESINMNLQQAGYELDRDDPDLLVLVSTQTDREVERRRTPVYARYPYTGTATAVRPFYNPYYYRSYNTFNHATGYDMRAYEYEEGTLIIHLVDRETEEVVWKGIASDNIYEQSTSEAIRQMVDDIFAEFPEQG